MKLFIKNNTDLPLEVIGGVYDDYVDNDAQITIFDGLINKVVFEHNNKDYVMEITYHIKQLSIVVDELNVKAKDIDTKDLKFPRLPKKKVQ